MDTPEFPPNSEASKKTAVEKDIQISSKEILRVVCCW
jgi:hypothetical protein